MRVERCSGNPIVRPGLDDTLGDNINGPSLIRVPEWTARPLGRYYLYFAHHDGRHIRLAYSDTLAGPWRIHRPGVLPLAGSFFRGHVASPDVHVDHERQEIRLYYHGSDTVTGGGGEQYTRVALSKDGLHFTAREEKLGLPYFRVFRWRDHYYALGMPGVFYRSRDGLSGFEKGPTLFTRDMRHTAVAVEGDRLSVFYTDVGDCPERILHATIELAPDWQAWKPSAASVVLEPELDYEGANVPRAPSVRGLAKDPVCELRDPALYEEGVRRWLLWSVAGERGIAIGELIAER